MIEGQTCGAHPKRREAGSAVALLNILLVASLLFAFSISAREPLIQVAPAGSATIRLATEPRDDDPLTQAAKRAADDPWPNAGTVQILEAAHQRDQQEWEQV